MYILCNNQRSDNTLMLNSILVDDMWSKQVKAYPVKSRLSKTSRSVRYFPSLNITTCHMKQKQFVSGDLSIGLFFFWGIGPAYGFQHIKATVGSRESMLFFRPYGAPRNLLMKLLNLKYHIVLQKVNPIFYNIIGNQASINRYRKFYNITLFLLSKRHRTKPQVSVNRSMCVHHFLSPHRAPCGAWTW